MYISLPYHVLLFQKLSYDGSISIPVLCPYPCTFFLDPNRPNVEPQVILAKELMAKGTFQY